jgi:Flp pilus assembly protein TadG
VGRQERGAITVWFAATSFAMVLIVGITVDLGGRVHAQQRVHNVAAQAARTGAEAIDGPTAVEGGGTRIDVAAARAAAQAYLDAAGVRGTVTITGAGHILVVHTTGTYHTKFLGIIGLRTMDVTGEGSARLIRVQGGVER